MIRRNPNFYPSPVIELRPSIIVPGEVGVFAVVNLETGTVVGRSALLGEGPFVKWQAYRDFNEATRQKIDAFCLGTEEGFTLPCDFNYMSVPWYINHSCDPNIGFDEEDNFITIRDVMAGEELAYDYGTAEANPRFRLKCSCGSPNCRREVTGNDWNGPEFRKEKERYMMSFLKKK